MDVLAFSSIFCLASQSGHCSAPGSVVVLGSERAPSFSSCTCETSRARPHKQAHCAQSPAARTRRKNRVETVVLTARRNLERKTSDGETKTSHDAASQAVRLRRVKQSTQRIPIFQRRLELCFLFYRVPCPVCRRPTSRATESAVAQKGVVSAIHTCQDR